MSAHAHLHPCEHILDLSGSELAGLSSDDEPNAKSPSKNSRIRGGSRSPLDLCFFCCTWLVRCFRLHELLPTGDSSHDDCMCLFAVLSVVPFLAQVKVAAAAARRSKCSSRFFKKILRERRRRREPRWPTTLKTPKRSAHKRFRFFV